MPDIPEIPFDILNQFVFETVNDRMHPSLRAYLRDMKYLHHEKETKLVDSVEQWWPVVIPYYHCMPFFFNDVLPLSDETLLSIGKAHILFFADSIYSDNIVDNQLDVVSGAFLTLSHIREEAQHLLRPLFPHTHVFWDIYHECDRDFWWGFAHELQTVVHQKEALTIDGFFKICEGKFAIYRRSLAAMGHLSEKTDNLEIVMEAFRKLFIADCIMDDAGDWHEDALSGRRTLPITMAMQRRNVPIEDFHDLRIEQLESIVHRSQITIDMTNKALSYLDEATQLLEDAQLDDSFLAYIIKSRHEDARNTHRVFEVVRGFDNFLSNFQN